ncbi:FAD-binding protein [Cryobacterium algoricola]|uniref:FAD-binding protein n=2 Tax=Cryobacterium TaxID=69578 RepID=A0AA41QW39_9MICO|nr:MULTISPECIES: FAD-linked oxidase C-terminal domain-containing protein [Cryobacterium]MCI4658766.1 FAD-binding protein [Cryobacterium zhongshanensis]TFB83749.1 FAD-binding protein [Cryobacterium algoricola]
MTETLSPQTILEELAGVLPQAQLVTGQATEAYLTDQSDGTAAGEPLAVVFPKSTAEVAAIVTLAAANGIPLVPQGARTGLAGGANSITGAIVVNLTRMNRIVSVDTADQTATVEAGVRTYALARAAAAAGLFYPPDPGSWKGSTIGGNVATNAGGMLCVKYGVTGNFVRRLTVVLADGSIVHTGQRTIKGVAGYNLTALLVGSEGTLGIITEITVGLLPAPAPASGVSATFSTTAEALAAAALIVTNNRRPSVLEFLDGSCITAINAFDPASTLPEGAAALLLVQSDAAGQADDDVAEYARILEAGGAGEIVIANDPAHLDQLMSARRLLQPALQAARGASLNEDVTVPRSQLQALLSGLQEISRELLIPISTGGHLGDGNLHPVIGFDPDLPAEVDAAHRAFKRVIQLAVTLGGSASGEHGIGLLKQAHLDDELGLAVRELQRRVKLAFDPASLLNPGKKL